MSKDLTVAVTAEIAKPANKPIALYEVYLASTTLYFAEWDVNIVFDGRTYLAYPITHEAIKSDMEQTIDAVRINVGNINQTFSRYLAEENGLRGVKVRILTVFENLLDDADNKVIRFEGYISEASLSVQAASFVVVSKLDLQDVLIPRRIYLKDFCSWVYKDTDTCGYTGTLPTCTKTLLGTNGCRAHNNTLRFGGFPAIPERRTTVS